MHLYAPGGHGFGLRRTKFPITGWPQLVETWLSTIGMNFGVAFFLGFSEMSATSLGTPTLVYNY